MNEPVLSIHCLVYNHGPYLRQCLDGFVMQKTGFPFEAIVHDDCSTDNSAAIIREYAQKYPDIIKPIYERENMYKKIGFSGIDRIMFANTHGKYIAVCEGDDYWTDPHKLQKHVDFLESHSDFGLHYTQAYQLNQQTGEKTMGWARQSDFEHAILSDSPIITLCACYRKELLDDYETVVQPKKEWLMSDYPKWLYIAQKSKIQFDPTITGVYRQLSESASHNTNVEKQIRFSLNAHSIRTYFANKCNVEHLLPVIHKNEFNDLCKIAVRNNTNLFHTLWDFSATNHIQNVRIILKTIIFSSNIGRKYHINKYS